MILDRSMHVEQKGSMLPICECVVQMGFKYVKANEFEKGKEDKWPKHKANAVKDDMKEDNDE